MYTPETFAPELSKIASPSIRKFTEHMLHKIPPCFWDKPSSSTGKYHPRQSNGKGGLVRHSRATVLFAETFARAFDMNREDTDCIIASAILHDCVKYGLTCGAYTTKTHDKDGADFIYVNGQSYIAEGKDAAFTSETLLSIIRPIAHHMGRWTEHSKKKKFPEEYSPAELIIHLADMASATKGVAIEYLEEETVGIG